MPERRVRDRELDAASAVDLDRYPLDDPGSPVLRRVIADARDSLARLGVAILPGFVRPEALACISRTADALRPKGHLEDVWGTPYLGLPDESFPEGHPRRTPLHSLTWVIAYDLIPRSSTASALYEWDALMRFIGEVLEKRPLYRMADPLGALNLTVMEPGHVQCWHYDNADFVVSLAVRASEEGGKFECAPFVRSAQDENYEDVARVIAGDAADLVRVFPMTPGTLMIFAGRHSIHRVSPVAGPVSRQVALFAYDSRPDADSSDLFKLVRYGRSEVYARPS
jgi:hypothetical protein